MMLLDEIEHKGPYFVMMIGLPGVGKSTFRKGIEDSAIVLSTDDWIQDKAEWEGTTYDAIWERDIKQAESAMRAALSQGIKDRANIILDRTNLSPKKRQGFLSQLPSDYFTMALVFDTPDAEEHARRLNRPGKSIPEHVVENMRRMLADNPVSLSEGWDLISGVPAS